MALPADPRLAEIITDLRAQAATRTVPDTEHLWSCPGCWSWQLHCSGAVAAQWEPKAFADLVEDILREHVAHECTHPQLVHFLWKQRGSR